MEKFYYYAFQSKGFFGSGIRYADDGCFNLAEMHKFLQETYKKRCVITFWKEITCEEYEKMSDYLEDGRGDKMKNYQFEEITFWLSFISCLISYHLGIEWLTGILVVVTALNLFWSIVTAWEDVKENRNDQSKDEINNRKEE